MNGNAELLNFVYQNSQMGVETIEQLLGIVEDGKFKEHLKTELNEYNQILQQAKKLLNSNGFDEKGISAFEKIRTYLMINIQTLTNKTESHIAEMMLIGSNMGVIDAIKKRKEYANAEPDILALMKKLLDFEEHNMCILKTFL